MASRGSHGYHHGFLGDGLSPHQRTEFGSTPPKDEDPEHYGRRADEDHGRRADEDHGRRADEDPELYLLDIDDKDHESERNECMHIDFDEQDEPLRVTRRMKRATRLRDRLIMWK